MKDRSSVWKLSADRTRITFSDGFKIGTLKLKGTRDLSLYGIQQIKRVRLVRRADGHYVQFCIAVDRIEPLEATGKIVGLDMGLEAFYTDSNGKKVDNPKLLRRAEKALKRAQRRVSKKLRRTKKGEQQHKLQGASPLRELPSGHFTSQSKNYLKAKQALGRKHLKVSRQRKDFAIKTARCVVRSNDLVAIEDLQVLNMVKNHCLAKSISDASWAMFRDWLEYFGRVYGRQVIVVAPHYTSQECSRCHAIVKKALSTRTHTCQCGLILCRDWNAAINILRKALQQISTEGHSGTASLELENTWGELATTVLEQSKMASRFVEPRIPCL